MKDSLVIPFFMEMMLGTVAIGLAVVVVSLCTMLVRSIYRDWDRM